jgi:hypothetical protein
MCQSFAHFSSNATKQIEMETLQEHKHELCLSERGKYINIMDDAVWNIVR